MNILARKQKILMRKIVNKRNVVPLLCGLILTGCSAQADASTASTAASAAETVITETESAALTQTEETSTETDVSAAAIPADEAFDKSLFAMDTTMTLIAYGPHANAALDAAADEINRLDALFSISSDTGDIFRANRDGSSTLSADTKELLSRSLDFAAETGGLLEPTIEPVMNAWGFTTKNYRVPSQDELKELLSHVDYRQVEITGDTLTLPENVQIDLGAIAKGYTSARVMDVFRDAGLTSGIISLGGNVQALGHKPDGSLWRVGIQDPKDSQNVIAIVEIADEAVITSGTYQRYFEQDGVTYHHIIDPRTGYPADSGLTSVSIISKDGTLADAMSTSLFIMGAEKAGEFWKEHRDEFDAIMMDEDGTVYVTAGLADRCTIKTGGPVEVIS